MNSKADLRNLPSVEKIIEDERVSRHVNPLSRNGVTRIVREVIDEFRKRLIENKIEEYGKEETTEMIASDTAAKLEEIDGQMQRSVINATGVVLHTNLGRSIMGEDVCLGIQKAASGYVDLEMDLYSGERVKRDRRIRRLLTLLTGAEDALVVNNNAAAVFLAVQTIAGDGAVAVSRGELVEIGGSFRLPEILGRAAGRVIEVGTTNRTHLSDYERAVDEGASLILKVNTSNYHIMGFTNEVMLKSLVDLGRRKGVPVMYDQGSGILHPIEFEGSRGEECADRILEIGVDLLSFSADKMLGAPQGGIILGSSDIVGTIRDNQISRVLRVGKLTLAGLERTLRRYWRGELNHLPALNMITMDVDTIRARAERLLGVIEIADDSGVGAGIVEGESSIGGGSYPINPLRTALVEITLPPGKAMKLSRRLRTGEPAVLVRVKGDSLYMDLRTVLEEEETVLRERLEESIRSTIVGE